MASQPPPPFPVPSGRFWAKLHPREHPERWHPLIAHSADVAAVLERLIEPGTPLADRLAALLGQAELRSGQRARLVFLAALHDMGKTNHGFQTKARPTSERGSWTPAQRGHVKLLLESMAVPALQQLVLREILPVLGRDAKVAAVLWSGAISHHGRPWASPPAPKREALWLVDTSGRDPLEEVRRLVLHARRWSGVDHIPDESLAPVPSGFSHLFAGALTLADWIGSTESAFPFAPEADDDPDGYWEQARVQADGACRRIGVTPATTTVSLSGVPLLEQIFPAVFRGGERVPTHLQRHISEMPLPSPGSRLLIESETGSGKTEAALALYARLRAAGQVGGLMFALPTRATASAMHERVLRALDGMYEGEERPTVALAVGGQQPRAETDSDTLREPSHTWDDEREKQELTNWASSGSKKFLAAEIVVGTLDQALLAGLPVRHANMRLAALSRHLLVVDELHSFDRYMTEVLANLLDLHTGAGGIALFMSATLSEAARRRFGGGPETTLEEAKSKPYPAVSACRNPRDGWIQYGLPRGGRSKTIRWRAVSEKESRTEAVQAAYAGARVCILCNTVRRAGETVAALREAGHAALLWRPEGSPHRLAYHARYAAPDRQTLDDAVLKRFGKQAAEIGGGVILVATQVVEQSLDVDFDLLITDLCPVDVLLQRIGREHRHPERDAFRPAEYRAAQALVVAPEGGFTPRLTSRSHPLGWGEDRPYTNYADGELTLRLIGDPGRSEIEIPRDNRLLVESVYHEEPREALRGEPNWEDYFQKAEGREFGQEHHGREAALRFDQSYTACAAQFTAAQEHEVRTRLGDNSVRFRLSRPVQCWYISAKVDTVDLPLYQLRASGLREPDQFPETLEATGETVFRVGIRTLEYTPNGWTWL